MYKISNYSQTVIPINKNIPINRNNINEKIIDAYNRWEKYDDFELLDEVISFVNKNEIIIVDDDYAKGRLIYINAVKIYISERNLKRIKVLLEAALDIAENNNDNNLIAASDAFIGLIMQINKSHIPAINYNNKALKIYKKINANHQLIDVHYNLSLLNIKIKQWKISEENALEAVRLIINLDTKNDRLKHLYSTLALDYIYLGDTIKVDKYLKKAEELTPVSFLNSRKKILLTYARYYKSNGKFKESFKKYNELFKVYDDNRQFIRNELYQVTKHELNIKRELKITKNKILKTNKRILIISLLFLVISLLYMIKKLLLSKKLKKSFLEINMINYKLENSFKELNLSNSKYIIKNKEADELLIFNEKGVISNAKKITSFNETILGVTNNITELLKNESIESSNLLQIEKKLKMMVDEKDVWKNFLLQFEKTRPNFFKKLKKIEPNLSVNDLKHCSYVIIKLRVKDVANLINISPRSVETARYRIKKKLNINENSTLYNFLQDI